MVKCCCSQCGVAIGGAVHTVAEYCKQHRWWGDTHRMTESKSEQTNDLQKVEEKARKVLSNENDAIDSGWASIAHDINHICMWCVCLCVWMWCSMLSAAASLICSLSVLYNNNWRLYNTHTYYVQSNKVTKTTSNGWIDWSSIFLLLFAGCGCLMGSTLLYSFIVLVHIYESVCLFGVHEWWRLRLRCCHYTNLFTRSQNCHSSIYISISIMCHAQREIFALIFSFVDLLACEWEWQEHFTRLRHCKWPIRSNVIKCTY